MSTPIKPIPKSFISRLVRSPSIVDSIMPPGEHDFATHHGKRYCVGHKVTWAWETFEDLRDKPELVAAIEAEQKRRKPPIPTHEVLWENTHS